jgi:hypothetical protein
MSTTSIAPKPALKKITVDESHIPPLSLSLTPPQMSEEELRAYP